MTALAHRHIPFQLHGRLGYIHLLLHAFEHEVRVAQKYRPLHLRHMQHSVLDAIVVNWTALDWHEHLRQIQAEAN